MAWLSLHLPLSSLDLLILGLDFLLLCAIFVKLMDWALHGLSQAHQCGQEPQPTELEITLRASFFLSISWPVCMRHSEEGSVVHDLAISQVLPGAPRCSWAGLSEVFSFSWEHLDSAVDPMDWAGSRRQWRLFTRLVFINVCVGLLKTVAPPQVVGELSQLPPLPLVHGAKKDEEPEWLVSISNEAITWCCRLSVISEGSCLDEFGGLRTSSNNVPLDLDLCLSLSSHQ